MLLEGGLDDLESRPRPARGQLASRPWTFGVPPAGLRPARGENLPGVTLGALFHGLSHVLREVPQVSPALDKVPKRATMSGCAVTHKTQRIHLQRPTTQTKHTPQGTIALPKSQSTANRSLHSPIGQGKESQRAKTSGCALRARCKPYTNPPETQIDKPKQLGEVFPDK